MSPPTDTLVPKGKILMQICSFHLTKVTSALKKSNIQREIMGIFSPIRIQPRYGY
jgi:hypothetical protein